MIRLPLDPITYDLSSRIWGPEITAKLFVRVSSVKY